MIAGRIDRRTLAAALRLARSERAARGEYGNGVRSVVRRLAALAERAGPRVPRLGHSPGLGDVVVEVAQEFGLAVSTLQSRSRERRLVVARQVAMMLGRELTGAALLEIAAAVGRRDHTTVLYGLGIVRCRLEGDAALAAAVERIRERLKTKGGADARL